jgi:hypothetical protein
MPGRAPVGSIKREMIPVPYGNEMASEMFLDLDVELLEYRIDVKTSHGRPSFWEGERCARRSP